MQVDLHNGCKTVAVVCTIRFKPHLWQKWDLLAETQ